MNVLQDGGKLDFYGTATPAASAAAAAPVKGNETSADDLD
jgi:hypothetical protein